MAHVLSISRLIVQGARNRRYGRPRVSISITGAGVVIEFGGL